jgi:ferredoxin
MAGHGGDGRHGTLVHGSRRCPPETQGIAVRSDRQAPDPALAHRCWLVDWTRFGPSRDAGCAAAGARAVIAALLAERCTGCNACVEQCPTRVFEPVKPAACR